MKISVIIPFHEINDKNYDLLKKAIKSIEKQNDQDYPELFIVYPSEIEEELLGKLVPEQSAIEDGITPIFIKNEGKTDYQSQVNLGVDNVNTEYFSVLEFDDEYSETYFMNAMEYVDNFPEIDILMTMMIEVNEKNEGIKLTNETVWAQQFVGENGEMGYLNVNALKQYTDFKLSGAVIKTSEFKNLGGYKSNIKMTFMYEFLLRALNNASKIFTIPKIGYKHFATREGSLFDGYLKTMPIPERKFWFETATKESNFINDRPIDTSKIMSIVK